MRAAGVRLSESCSDAEPKVWLRGDRISTNAELQLLYRTGRGEISSISYVRVFKDGRGKGNNDESVCPSRAQNHKTWIDFESRFNEG